MTKVQAVPSLTRPVLQHISWVSSAEGWKQPSTAPDELQTRSRVHAGTTLGAAAEGVRGWAGDRFHAL